MKPIKFRPRKTLLGRLRELRRVLTNPKHWTQGKYAHYTTEGGLLNQAYGGITGNAKNGKVCAVCLEGGTLVVDNGNWGPTFRAVKATVSRDRYSSIPTFNDAAYRKHPEILEVLDQTINHVKAHGGGRAIIHD